MKNSSAHAKSQSTYVIAEDLGRLSSKWLAPRYPYRVLAIKRLAKKAGYTPKMAAAALDATFSELTAMKLLRLLSHEIGDPAFLDGFVRDPKTGHSKRAISPKTILHILSSNIANAAIWSLVMGLLVKSQNIIKLSKDDPGVMDLYLMSLRSHNLALYRRVKKLSSRHASVRPYLKTADVVVCYGDDETVRAVRSQLGPSVFFVGYGHRVSFAILLKEALTQKHIKGLAKKLALDAWMVDGKGCLSPVAIHAQSGGEVTPEAFEALFRKELLSLYQEGKGDYRTQTHALMASIRVPIHPFQNIRTVMGALRLNAGHLQAVALEGHAPTRTQLALELSALGVNRVCRVGRMQTPPITWHHDGKTNIAQWLTWTDLE